MCFRCNARAPLVVLKKKSLGEKPTVIKTLLVPATGRQDCENVKCITRSPSRQPEADKALGRVSISLIGLRTSLEAPARVAIMWIRQFCMFLRMMFIQAVSRVQITKN
jgi:hypothetical protein